MHPRFTLNSNKITFHKGYKPRSIHIAQRAVRSAYLELCSSVHAHASGDKPYSTALAATFLAKHVGNALDAYRAVIPGYIEAVASASRAFTALGRQLENRTMYSMNLYVPIGELSQFKDLPEGLEAALRASGLKEVVFEAREK